MGLGEAKGELADRNRFGVLLRVDSLESMPGVPTKRFRTGQNSLLKKAV